MIRKKIRPFKNFLIAQAQRVGRRRLAVCVTVGFGICLYLAEMGAQFFSRAVITGQGRLFFDPVRVIFRGLISGKTLCAAFLIFAAAACTGFFMLLQIYLEERRDMLGRFRLSESGDWGTAAFCEHPEALPQISLNHFRVSEGWLFGKMAGQYLSFNPKRISDNRNIIVYGAAGSGKTRGFILPNVVQLIRRRESAVILDTKGTVYRHTADLAEAGHYDIYRFDLKNPSESQGWHCLKDIGQDAERAHQAANVIIENTAAPGEKNAAKFWVDGEKNLLAALILFVNWEAAQAFKKSGRRKNRPKENTESAPGTMGRLYRILTAEGGFSALQAQFEAVRVQTGNEAPAWMAWQAFAINLREDVRGGIISGLATRLRLFQSPEICKMFGKDEIRLKNIGRRRTLLYVNLDDSDTSRCFLAALFITQIFSVLYAEADVRQDQRCPVPVNFICDEFVNMGKLPDFDKKIATCRSRGISVCIVVQTLGALMEMYPGRAWEQIVGNCAVELLMKAGDQTTADHFQWIAGQTTVAARDTAVFRRGLSGRIDMAEGYRENMSGRGRPLIQSDEIRRLPANKILAAVDNADVILAEKIDFSEFVEMIPEILPAEKAVQTEASDLELSGRYFKNLYKGVSRTDAENFKGMGHD